MSLGRRVYPDADGRIVLAPGDYGMDREGLWRARPPSKSYQGVEKQIHPMGGSLELHEVRENPDGTITVSPSIEIEYPYGPGDARVYWHGYLENGVWREV